MLAKVTRINSGAYSSFLGFQPGRRSSNPSLHPHHSPSPPPPSPKTQLTAGPKILANHRKTQPNRRSTSPPILPCSVQKIWAHYADQICKLIIID
ncbi:hypothetical protein WN944_022723 [Citrus x changshan-huyou]|uniref:Uncharacterized protein n=1 Tax=Citrus x changshan-huyou TaxID=2935761 RepID=A0AAP0MYZ4_9ROSI